VRRERDAPHGDADAWPCCGDVCVARAPAHTPARGARACGAGTASPARATPVPPTPRGYLALYCYGPAAR
jgi:hypothetical protein